MEGDCSTQCPGKRRRAWIIGESKYLKITEVSQLRSAAEELRDSGIKEMSFCKVRRWFMIELGLGAGLRVSEMASLRIEDFMINNGRSSIRVLGKGDKLRFVWIGTALRSACVMFLNARKRLGFSNDSESFILSNSLGTRIHKRSLQKDFKAVLLKAGLVNYSIHCLRHTYATFLLEASQHDYRFVQRQLGHASLSTTQVYAGVVESSGREALEKIYQ